MELKNQTVAKLEGASGRTNKDNSFLKGQAESIGCEYEVLQAIVNVESRGKPYDNSGRLLLLPEKHIFYKELPDELKTIGLKKGLALKKWDKKIQYKGFGRSGSDSRWAFMDEMAQLQETAALRSASWGKPQIMGFNAEMCGYANVQAMLFAFSKNEEEQDKAFIAYLIKRGAKQALKTKDFRTVARLYNGPGQVDQYAGLMATEYTSLTGGSPVQVTNRTRATGLRTGSTGPRVTALQKRLNEVGYISIAVDDDFGPSTEAAVIAFQKQHNIDVDGIVGPETQAALDEAPIVVNEKRESTTVADMRGKSRIIDSTSMVKTVTSVGGGVTVAGKAIQETGLLDKASEIAGNAEQAKGIFESLLGTLSWAANYWWILIPIIAVVVYYYANKAQKARVEDKRSGKTV